MQQNIPKLKIKKQQKSTKLLIKQPKLHQTIPNHSSPHIPFLRTWNKRDALFLVPSRPQKRHHLLLNLPKPLLPPPRRVQLVHHHNQVTHAKRPHEQRVLLCLPVIIKSAFEFAAGGVDYEQGSVGLGGARDHVGDKVAVAGGVEESDAAVGGVKGGSGDIHRHATRRKGEKKG